MTTLAADIGGTNTRLALCDTPESPREIARFSNAEFGSLDAVIRHYLAERGHPRAQDRMAQRRLTGDGVPQDEVEALKWAILAAAQGVESAQKLRFQLTTSMSEAEIAEAEKRAAAFAPRKGPVLNLPRAPGN